MTLFTRATAQGFRALFARCVTGRPRGPAPPVVIQTRRAVRTLAATTSEGVTLTHTVPTPREPDALLMLPASVFAEVEGGVDEPVTLDRSPLAPRHGRLARREQSPNAPRRIDPSR